MVREARASKSTQEREISTENARTPQEVVLLVPRMDCSKCLYAVLSAKVSAVIFRLKFLRCGAWLPSDFQRKRSSPNCCHLASLKLIFPSPDDTASIC